MRNLFDQYDQPENRLSHALAVCLDEDRTLLREFLSLIGAASHVPAERLVVQEQSLPGEPPPPEEIAERRGLPDIIIHDDNSWCVLIESKIQAGLTDDQLLRHRRTVEKRGFKQITLIALTKDGVPARTGVVHLYWPRIYEWLGSISDSMKWCARLRGYLRAAEVRMARNGYLQEGTLTQFDGFPFAEEPYTYGEAKRLLKLTMNELRLDPRLSAMEIDRAAGGRAAITGSATTSVWDYILLQGHPPGGAHTSYPHLTLGVHTDGLMVYVTVPNGCAKQVWPRLAHLKPDGLHRLHQELLRTTGDLRAQGARVTANILQRHYPSQRHAGIQDANCSFRLETTHSKGEHGVKHVPAWEQLLWSLLESGHVGANTQLYYTVEWNWEEGQGVLDRREVLDTIVNSWVSLKPFLDVARGKSSATQDV